MPASCALFGKVQTRRDFIAVATPRAFLSAWEPWVQSAVAASRDSLRARWNDAFLTAPIWRFWLGSDICGSACLGAIMPSMDGIGRYFPLTLACCAETGTTFRPPEQDLQPDWFDRAETFLLGTLEMRDHEEMLRLFEAIAPPSSIGRVSPPEGSALATGGETAFPVHDAAFDQAFSRWRRADPHSSYASSTFWWTAGGADYAPCAFASLRLPNPAVFAAMLTGDFAIEGALP